MTETALKFAKICRCKEPTADNSAGIVFAEGLCFYFNNTDDVLDMAKEWVNSHRGIIRIICGNYTTEKNDVIISIEGSDFNDDGGGTFINASANNRSLPEAIMQAVIAANKELTKKTAIK